MAEAVEPSSDGDILTIPGPSRNPAPDEASPLRGRLRAAVRAVAAVLLVELVLLAAWWIHGQWRLGRVVLTNDGDPLTVEVLHDSRDDVIAGPVAVLNRTTLELPDGDYRLRISGSGRPGRTVRMAVNRGELLTHQITLDDSRLLGEAPVPPMGLGPWRRPTPIPATAGHLALEMTPGRCDFIEWSSTQLSRRDGASGQILWDALAPAKPGEPARKLDPWLVWFARSVGQERLIIPAADLDGDGVRDLVWTYPQRASFLALSGKDGSILWTYVPELDGPGSPRPESLMIPGPVQPVHRSVRILPEPAFLDVDRDGTPEIIATLVFQELPDESAHRASDSRNPAGIQQAAPHFRRVIQAISGRSGKVRWAHSLDARFAPMNNADFIHGADVVTGREESFIGYLTRNAWRVLDPATGKTVIGPTDLRLSVSSPARYADLDGDGVPELIAVAVGGSSGTASSPLILAAYDLPSGRRRWSAPVSTAFELGVGMYSSRDWPVLVALDGAGRRGLVVPDVGSLDGVNKYRGVRCIDGSTGGTLWTRPMRPDTISPDGVLGAVEAPDLDGDGARDVITASFFVGRNPIAFSQAGPDGPARIYIDALSGRDGRPLWWWDVDVPTDRLPTVGTPLWWGRGPDGWPLLAVPINATTGVSGLPSMRETDLQPPLVHMLEASTGREVQAIRGLINPQVHDLDGDGLADLWGDHERTLRAFGGGAPELWRALDVFAPARASDRRASATVPSVADLDGDGIGDLLLSGLSAPGDTAVRESGSRTAVARSGRDGRLLWKSRVDARRGWFDQDVAERYELSILPLPAGDLDGDGVPEVLVEEVPTLLPVQVVRGPATLPLSVLSGRTGRTLWVVGSLPLGFEAHGYSQVAWTRPVVVETGSPPDLLVRHASPFRAASTTPIVAIHLQQDRLARISGRTGQILWDVPLADRADPTNANNLPPPVVDDFDGDGSADLAFVYRDLQDPANPPVVVKAVSLRNGEVLWSSTFDEPGVPSAFMRSVRTSETRPPMILLGMERYAGRTLTRFLRGFDGRTGRPSWRWESGLDRNWNLPHENPPDFVVARQGEGKPDVIGVYLKEEGGKWWIVLVEAGKGERLRRLLPGQRNGMIRAVDLDGDARDELLIWYGDRLHAHDIAFRELWSRPGLGGLLPLIFGASGREALVSVPPRLILEGPTGRPIWEMQRAPSWREADREILDPGTATRPPLVVSYPVRGQTVVSTTISVTDQGIPSPPAGAPVPPGASRADPRWTRLLPWVLPVGHTLGFRRFMVLIGLAVANVLFPLGIVWLAARRRRWSLLTLMALPVAAAVPLAMVLTFEPLIPAQLGATPVSPRLVFALGTLAGVPFVALIVAAGGWLVRRRWKRLAGWSALALAATAAIALTWLYHDSRGMPAIEHYGRSGWPLVLAPGAFATGILILIAWPMERVYRWLKRPRRPELANL